MKMREIPQTDHVVDSIIDQFVQRATFGKEKYGVGLERKDLSLEDYLQHALEEHMDAILYLNKSLKIVRNQDQ
jgi:hypothetical protein